MEGALFRLSGQRAKHYPDVMRTFERYAAGRAAKALAVQVYTATGEWPVTERYGLTAQVRAAATSIGSNLCEGAARRGPREFRRFLDQALGSHAELEFQLALARDLGYLTEGAAGELDKRLQECGRLLWQVYRRAREQAERS